MTLTERLEITTLNLLTAQYYVVEEYDSLRALAIAERAEQDDTNELDEAA